MNKLEIRAQLAAVRAPLYRGLAAPVINVAPGVTVTAYRMFSTGAGFAWHHVYRVESVAPISRWGQPYTDRCGVEEATDAVLTAIERNRPEAAS